MAVNIRFRCPQCADRSEKTYQQLRGADFKELACGKCGYVPTEIDIRLQLSELLGSDEKGKPGKKRPHWAA
jgi:uncharacterized Zn finger protein